MKKITFLNKLILLLLLTFSLLGFSQNDYYTILSGASTSGLGRAPQGSRSATRGVFIVTAAEMAAGGFVNGNAVSGITFTYSTAQDIATTGTMSVYLENTADAVNNKSTTWSTAITGMTTTSSGAFTIPNTPGDLNHIFSGGSAFTYTGAGLYIAFDYQNLTNPLATTSNVVLCNTAITNGLKSNMSIAGAGAAPPTTVANSTFRPIIKLAKPVSCARPTALGVSASTANSATMTWNAVGGSNVELEYGLYGFTQGTAGGTLLTGASVSSPYNLSSLNPSTVYQYYLRTNCGGGSYSVWNGPFTFNTTFQPANLPYLTSFEQETFPFIGWVLPAGTPVGSDWQIQNFGPASPTNTLVQDGSVSVYSLSAVTTTPANNWIISRGLNLTAGATVTVTFYVRNYVDTGSTGSAAFNVTVGNAQNVASQTINIGTQGAFATTTWEQKTYTFVPSTTGVYYLGIQNVSPANATGRQGLFLDNLSVSQVLSSQDFKDSSFAIYPNPTASVLNIDSKNGVTLNSLIIRDLNGRIIKEISKINATTTLVDVNDLNSGVYFITISTSEGSGTNKFIKQ